MLASTPASILNQNPSDLGIPNGFSHKPSCSEIPPLDCAIGKTHAIATDARQQLIALSLHERRRRGPEIGPFDICPARKYADILT